MLASSYRLSPRHPDRQSAKVVELGELVLEGGHVKRLKDDVWAFLEQVALAALDVGKMDLAEVRVVFEYDCASQPSLQLCIARLNTRFPNSNRVAALLGMVYEANGEYQKALNLYDTLLSKDEANPIIVKRLVAVLRVMDDKDGRGGVAGAIATLVKYLDTYYNDIEGWQELASLYTEQRMCVEKRLVLDLTDLRYRYPQAIFALEELILLSPHNSFFVLQYAETLATQGDLVSSYQQYLRVVEMCERHQKSGSLETGPKQGPWLRALWGLKVVINRFRAIQSSSRKMSKSGTSTEVPEQLDAIDAMVTNLLLNQTYHGASLGSQITRNAARTVLQV